VIHTRRFGVISTALILAAFATCYLAIPSVQAQSAKAKTKAPKPLSPSESKKIDVRLEKLQETFATESSAIIDDYESSGQYERAKFLMEVLLKLDPKNDTLKKRVSDLEEKILRRVEAEQKFNTAGDWTLMGSVQKDVPARIEATGEYKLNLVAGNIGPDGFPTEDIMKDLVGRVPTGALMGMIVTEANEKEKKPPEPFAVKAKHDFTPKHDGQLYLKVNVPAGSKCIGDLKLKLNGIATGHR
jgi:hypothetical protein